MGIIGIWNANFFDTFSRFLACESYSRDARLRGCHHLRHRWYGSLDGRRGKCVNRVWGFSWMRCVYSRQRISLPQIVWYIGRGMWTIAWYGVMSVEMWRCSRVTAWRRRLKYPLRRLRPESESRLSLSVMGRKKYWREWCSQAVPRSDIDPMGACSQWKEWCCIRFQFGLARVVRLCGMRMVPSLMSYI